MNKLVGFTTVELLVTMSIVVIIMFIAIPAYRTTVDSYNISSEMNNLTNDLNYARSEAVRQGANIVVCSSNDGNTCNVSANWATGWIVMMPRNGLCTDTTSSASRPLRVQRAINSQNQIAFSSGSYANPIVCYSRLGVGGRGVLTFSSPYASSNPNQFNKQCLVLSGGGVPRIVPFGSSGC